jgi:hypothetical protein
MAKRSVLEGIPRKTVTAPGKRGRNVSIVAFMFTKSHGARWHASWDLSTSGNCCLLKKIDAL